MIQQVFRRIICYANGIMSAEGVEGPGGNQEHAYTHGIAQ